MMKGKLPFELGLEKVYQCFQDRPVSGKTYCLGPMPLLTVFMVKIFEHYFGKGLMNNCETSWHYNMTMLYICNEQIKLVVLHLYLS